jgi:hypothetical protein
LINRTFLYLKNEDANLLKQKLQVASMSVHRLVSQQSHIVTSLMKQSAVAVASNVLQIQPDWLYQVELDHAQECLEAASILALSRSTSKHSPTLLLPVMPIGCFQSPNV